MELSRDKIKEIINDDWLLMDDCEGNKNCDVVKEMARIALASLEAEPVAWLLSGGGAKNNVSFDSGNAYADPLREVTPLYTAPPAPVSVPAAMEIDDGFDSAFEHGKAVGWNAYRAAMFQSGNFRENKNSSTNNFREIAETSTNYPVIPSEVLSAIQKVAKIRADFDDFDGDRRGIGDCLDEAEQELIVTINKYASQLAAEPVVPAVLERLRTIVADPRALPRRKEWVSGQQYSYVLLENVEAMVDEACHAAMLQGSQPVSQTYKFPVNTPCQDAPAHIWLQTAGVWPEDGELSELTWCSHNQHHDDTLYVRADLVNGNSQVTPDGWISCSERMPNDAQWCVVNTEYGYYVQCWSEGQGWLGDDTSIPECDVINWMPLPEPPQEVNP